MFFHFRTKLCGGDQSWATKRYFKKFPLQDATFRITRGIVGKGETNQP